jgi:hypothetical protein
LISIGGDVNIKTAMGRSSLQKVVWNGQYELL